MSKNGPLIKSLGYGPTIKSLSNHQPQNLIIFTTPEHKKEQGHNSNGVLSGSAHHKSKRIILDLDNSGQRLPLNKITKGSSLISSSISPQSTLPQLILGGKYLNHYLPGPKVVNQFIQFCALELPNKQTSLCAPTGLVLIKLLTAAVKKCQQ